MGALNKSRLQRRSPKQVGLAATFTRNSIGREVRLQNRFAFLIGSFVISGPGPVMTETSDRADNQHSNDCVRTWLLVVFSDGTATFIARLYAGLESGF
jgi:hypothetical protein